VRGNPLVAGYQEDLGSDDEQVAKKPTTSSMRQVELSSDDEDVTSADLTLHSKVSVARPSPTVKIQAAAAPPYAKSNTNGSASLIAASRPDFNSNRTSIQAEVHSATADSSDELEDNGHVVLKDEDISDEEPADQVENVVHMIVSLL
jgi:hypothetical protein